jgi:flagellar biogenesis protein FliO
MSIFVRHVWRILPAGLAAALLVIAPAAFAGDSASQSTDSAAVAASPAESPASAPSDSARNQESESRLMRSRSGGGAVLGRGLGRSSSPESLWWQTALVLAIVLGAMWVVLRWLRKRGIGVSFGGSDSAVQVLNRGYLAGKHQMVLVRFGERILLLGVTPQSINVLSEISNPEEAAQVLGRLAGAKAGSASRDFQQAITEAADEYVEPGAAAVPELVVHTPSQEQIGQIRGEIRGLLSKMQSLGGERKAE